MAKLTKKQKALVGKVDSNKLYALTDALAAAEAAEQAARDEKRRQRICRNRRIAAEAGGSCTGLAADLADKTGPQTLADAAKAE